MYYQGGTRGTKVKNRVGREEFIAFIGPHFRFSESLARSVCIDLGATGVVRFDSFQEFFDTAVQSGRALRIVVVDENLAPDILRLGPIQREALKRFTIALAYRDSETVKRLYSALSHDGVVRSLVPMDTCLDVWLSVMRLIASGGAYLPPDIVSWAQSQEHNDNAEDDDVAPQRLTPRERQVLALVAGGAQNKHIAAKLGLSEHTIKLHIHHIISKLGVRNRTEATARYFKTSDV